MSYCNVQTSSAGAMDRRSPKTGWMAPPGGCWWARRSQGGGDPDSQVKAWGPGQLDGRPPAPATSAAPLAPLTPLTPLTPGPLIRPRPLIRASHPELTADGSNLKEPSAYGLSTCTTLSLPCRNVSSSFRRAVNRPNQPYVRPYFTTLSPCPLTSLRLRPRPLSITAESAPTPRETDLAISA